MTTDAIAGLPRPLRAIYEQATRGRRESSNLADLRSLWEAHVARARRQIPGLCVEGEEETLYLGELSPGCRACREGTWDCIFTTMRCNLDCEFCYSPRAIPRDYAGSLLGRTPEQIAANHDRTQITGVSFSGGEPFLHFPALYRWVSWFANRYPDKYTWVYTNGLLATADKVEALARLGLDEMRFNLAAAGYDQPLVMANLAATARLVPNVTVEIPAIPQDADRVLSCLATWAAHGVRYLNLHELMYEPGTNSATMAGARQPIVTSDGHRSEINPQSRDLTLAVMVRVQQESLPLSVNDCSLQSKLRQLRGRRRCLAPLVKAPYEELVRDEVYESYCAYSGEECIFLSPASLTEMRSRHPEFRFVRLVRTAPLAIDDGGQWISFDWV